ncbi:MAG: DUF58 domain-containing protein [Gammaproteobacteria bacterium]|nr:DUF58 domain-containing protein [Gammaproteobacteria bacterium]
MIPHARLIGVALALAAVGIPVIWLPALAPAWSVLAAAAAIVAAVDALVCRGIAVPTIERKTPGSLSLGNWSTIRLLLQNDHAFTRLRLRVFDHYPPEFRFRDLPQELAIEKRHFAELAYEVCPAERGLFEFPGCELLLRSPLGLWWRRRKVPLRTAIRVYPNYSTIAKLLMHEADNPLSTSGVRLRRRRGQGTEFEQLRDYRDGDPLRSIDWKATARLSRLISREYQDERDQQVVFLLDTGRRMLAKDAQLSHFDHALNAMILLSYVALRHGDAVGIMTAGAERRWLPPRKGMQSVNALLNHVYDVQPQPIEIDYIAAATELSVKQRRRSLIVILTNIREEDSDDLRSSMLLLRRRHLVILASLRERALDETIQRPLRRFRDALDYASTDLYLESRRASQDILRASGVLVEDCLCEELPAAITNQYLAVKRAGAL